MQHFVKKNKRFSGGFTLLETLLAVGILAIITTISITSIVVIRKNMRIKECDDNARTIYMAAQATLTQMRTMGQLPLLEEAASSDGDAPIGGNCVYTYSQGEGSSYDLMVPGSVDAHIRDQQVILEYHPKSGIVYAVFYYEGSDSLLDLYVHHSSLRENADLRKDLQIGYYTVGDVDAINSEEFTLYQISADLDYINGEEAILTVSVPVKDQKGFDIFTDVDPYSYIASRLEITLSVSGAHGGQFTKTFQIFDGFGAPLLDYSADYAQYKLQVSIPLDSLTDSFANLGLQMVEGTLQNPIAAGDNISVTAALSFSPGPEDPILLINSATMADINPMFHGLEEEDSAHILTISNGRHLQNLNRLDEDFSKNIDSIRFVKENGEDSDFVLDWYEDVDFVPISNPILPQIDGDGVEIHNLNITASAGVLMNGSTQRYGGLFGALSDTIIENITLVNPVIGTIDAISTGGLIGYAQGVTIENCHITGASVTGSGNVGGLVGSALDTNITDCTVQSTSVSSIPNTGTDSNKNALGGLVGHSSNSSTNTDFAISGCEVTNSVTVTGVLDSRNDLGGMVGFAANAYFSQCKASALVTGQGTIGKIPNNNLGGFVGRSEGSRYAVIDVTLGYIPQYAADAGGFGGVLSGDSVENLDVVFTSNPTAKITLTNFGGIASILSGGTVTRASVVSTNVKGTPEAKFNQATNTAGFVVTNTGTIRRCFSNVVMDGGFCFVKTNNGTVKNCYGWVWGNDNRFDLEHCTHSYFVDGSGDVWLYDENGALSGRIPDTGALADIPTIDLLNSGNVDAPWVADSTAGYPYPILKDVPHSGRHAAPVTTSYPYALRYVETYPNGTGELIMVYDEDGDLTDITDHLQNETIYDTAYYLYHRTDPNLIEDGIVATYSSGSEIFDAGWESLEEFHDLASPELFTAYRLDEDASFDSLNLQTYYPLYSTAGGYRIRTGQQFANLAQNPAGTFYLDHDITLSTTLATFSGKLYGGNHTIEAQVPLFGVVEASALIENIHLQTGGTFQPFGDLPGSEIQATHWTATVQSIAPVDSFESTFLEVTGTPKAITIPLPGCTVNGESALVTWHYYQVDTETIQLVPGDSVAVELTEIQGCTYRDLTGGSYYVQSADGTSYEPLTVIATETGLILSANSVYLEKSLEELDAAVEIPLYAPGGNFPGSITTCYLLIEGRYLTASGELQDAVPNDFWTQSDGRYTCSGVALTTNDLLAYGQFTVQEIIRTYPCQYVGEATVMKEAAYD